MAALTVVDATKPVSQMTQDERLAVWQALKQVEARETQQSELEKCAADFWHFAKYVQTHDEDDEGLIRLFPTDFEYLHELFDALENDSPVLVIPKSRRMIATTTIATRANWKMLFPAKRVPTEGDNVLWSQCFVSINEKKAKKYVERLVGIYDLLPDWLKRPWTTATQLDRAIKNGGSVEALHAGGDGPRSEGYAEGVMDEEAFQQNARANYGALRQCARKVILISSANGRGNHFDEMWDDPTVEVLELHYSKHPHRRPETAEGEEWKRRAMVGQSRADWEREQEMNRDVYATAGYYGSDWTREVIDPEMKWHGEPLITIGMDYSYLNPAAVVSYIDDDGRWCRYWEYLYREMTLEKFCVEVFTDCKKRYQPMDSLDRSKVRFRVAPDPFRGRQTKGDTDAYGNPATDLSAISEYAQRILGEDTLVSIVTTGGMLRPEGHRRVRRGFIRRPDQTFGTRIHPRCTNLIQGFSGAYGPKDNATPGQLANEEPDTERKQVHVMDADRYGYCEFTVVDLGVEYDSGSRSERGRELAARARIRAMQERARRGLA